MTRKSLVAAAAQLKIEIQKCSLFLITSLFFIYALTPYLLAQQPESECHSHNLSTLTGSPDPELLKVATIITELEQAIEKSDTQTLLRMWHPRVRPTQKRLSELLTKLHFGLGKPVDLSLLRSWQVISDNSTQSIRKGIPCRYDDVTFFPLYGYSPQYGVLYQALGQKELGRLVLILVKVKQSFQIGFMHYGKWTHDGKNPSQWMELATRAKSDGIQRLAYLYSQIGAKLTRPNPHTAFASHQEFNDFSKQISNSTDELRALQIDFPGYKLAAWDTALVADGMGLSLRFVLPKEISSTQIRSHCLEQYSRMQELTWSKNQLQAIKCSYTIAGEEPEDREGRLGSILLHKNSIEEFTARWGITK